MEEPHLKNPLIAEYWLEDESRRREIPHETDKRKEEETAREQHDHLNFPGEERYRQLLDEVDNVLFSKTSDIQNPSSEWSQQHTNYVTSVLPDTNPEEVSIHDTYHVISVPPSPNENKKGEIDYGQDEPKEEENSHEQHDLLDFHGDETYTLMDEVYQALFPGTTGIENDIDNPEIASSLQSLDNRENEGFLSSLDILENKSSLPSLVNKENECFVSSLDNQENKGSPSSLNSRENEGFLSSLDTQEIEGCLSSLDEVEEVCFFKRYGILDLHSSQRLQEVTDEPREEVSIYDTYHVTYNTYIPEEERSSSLPDEVPKLLLSRSSNIQISGAAHYMPKYPQNDNAFPRENAAASRGLPLLLGENCLRESNRMQGTPLQQFITQVLSKIAVFIPASKFIFHQSDQRKTFMLSQQFFGMSCADKAFAVSPPTLNFRGVTEVSLTTSSHEKGKYALLKSSYPVIYKDSLDVSLPCSCPVTMTNTLMIGNEKKRFENMEVLIIGRKREFSALQSPSVTLQFLMILNDGLPEIPSIPITAVAPSTGLTPSVSDLVKPHPRKCYVIRVVPFLSQPCALNNNLTTEAVSSADENAVATYVCQFCKFKFNKLDILDHYRKNDAMYKCYV